MLISDAILLTFTKHNGTFFVSKYKNILSEIKKKECYNLKNAILNNIIGKLEHWDTLVVES